MCARREPKHTSSTGTMTEAWSGTGKTTCVSPVQVRVHLLHKSRNLSEIIVISRKLHQIGLQSAFIAQHLTLRFLVKVVLA